YGQSNKLDVNERDEELGAKSGEVPPAAGFRFVKHETSTSSGAKSNQSNGEYGVGADPCVCPWKPM
ncbi:MAG TPA: hypothetical protein PKL48_14225, partial [Thermodesulfobacteriota bacterium]|nr:hypothetical protein [Thermodesulfobacteriota bacterium]